MDDVTDTLKDTAYVAVGLGVLAFQRAQVRRRELMRWAQDVEHRLDPLLDDVEDRLDPVLDDLEGRLPEQASELLRQLRQTARDGRHHMRSRLTPDRPGERGGPTAP